MKRRSILLVILVVVAVTLFVAMEFVYLPNQEAQREQYQAEQLNPLTHHLDEVLPYQHPYMGNASNLSQLFGHLPLQDLPFTFQLYPDELTAELIFETFAAPIDQLHLQRSLIYNSTAAFALIANLESLHYTFLDATYTIDRSDVANEYGDPAALLDPEIWQSKIQEPLRDPVYVEESWTRLSPLKTE